jgi:uncharacterized membrane protein
MAIIESQERAEEIAMFERLFVYTVRNGSRILFGIALFVIAFGTFTSIWNTAHQSIIGLDAFLTVVSGIWGAFVAATTPLIAAIAIERYLPRK